MKVIRWEQDEDAWLGYLNGAYIAKIISAAYADENGYYLEFMGEEHYYSALYNAKRGAERLLKKFLDDAGLIKKVN